VNKFLLTVFVFRLFSSVALAEEKTPGQLREERSRIFSIEAARSPVSSSHQDSLGIQGGTAEIGVHHGKSFIPLCLGLRDGERAVCVDIFEDQAHNVDLSGQGSREKLDRNLERFSVAADRVVVLKASSFDVSAKQIVDAVGSVRFFSVDGGHWRDIVVNDLNIAGNAVGEMGVIALGILAGKTPPLFEASPFFSLPYLFNYLQAGSLAVFGPDENGLRMLSVLFGTACIPLLYALGKAGWGRLGGFAAAA